MSKGELCGNKSPLCPSGTWECDLPAGHKGFHESREGNWVWSDGPPVSDDDDDEEA
jgi:hypothetical protein